MNTKISPKYQMNLIQNINDKLFELYKGPVGGINLVHT